MENIQSISIYGTLMDLESDLSQMAGGMDFRYSSETIDSSLCSTLNGSTKQIPANFSQDQFGTNSLPKGARSSIIQARNKSAVKFTEPRKAVTSAKD